MEIVKSSTGSASLSDLQVQKSISHILITKTGTANAIVNEKISAYLKNGSSELVVIPLSKIRDVAIISQFENGYMLQQLLADATVECAFLLELTTGAAIALKDNDYLSVSVEGLEPLATYSIHGLEVLEEQRSYLKYNNTTVTGADSQQKQYSLGSESVSLAIRNNGALLKIRLYGNNNKEVTYTPKELSAIAREINGMTIGPDKLVEGDSINQVFAGGASDYFWLPTGSYKGFEITTVGGIDLSFTTVNQMAY